MLQPTTLRNQILETNPGYKRGGSVASSRKLSLAHLSPHELDIMDHLQGGKEINKKNGARSYSHLEELLHNPHLRNNICRIAKQCKAEGGSVENVGRMHGHLMEDNDEHTKRSSKLQRLLDLLLYKKKMNPDDLTEEELSFLEANGDHGDREMAQIGPRTHHLFDQIAGHKTRNPKTGLPEYWSIGDALSGMWDSVKGSGALEHLKNGAISAGKGLVNSGANRLMGYAADKLGLEKPGKFEIFKRGEGDGDAYDLGDALGGQGFSAARAKANAIAKKRLGYNEGDLYGNDRLPSLSERFKMGSKSLANQGLRGLANNASGFTNAALDGGLGGAKDYAMQGLNNIKNYAKENVANKFNSLTGGQPIPQEGKPAAEGHQQPQLQSASGLRSQEPIKIPQGYMN